MRLLVPYIITVGLLGSFVPTHSAELSSHTLWYQQPATNWQTDALPIGNGKLGAMVFGQVERERIMFNEDSLWIGDELDTGSYQAFGDIFVRLHPEAFALHYISPNQGQNASEGINQAFDGNADSKWCFEHQSKPIIAHIEVTGKATPLTEYRIVSGNDIPARDPSDWILEASHDGKSWQKLDQQTKQPQWSERKQERLYKVSNIKSYKHYRFTFQPSQQVPHFQVADIKLNISPTKTTAYSNYTRKLDLQEAIHRTSYTYNGVNYRREAFSSAPAGVMVFRFEADQKGAHTGSIQLTDQHDARISGQGTTLTASGNLEGYKYPDTKRHAKPTYQIALDYESQVRVLNEGGQIKIHNGHIAFKGCDSLTVIVAAGTNYLNQRDQGWKGEHPHQRISGQIAKAATTPYTQLKAQHVADYQKLYQRFVVTLPDGTNSNLPTDQRLTKYQTDRSDNSLEALQVHYARYLMIACSRPGSLPANLQGLWCDSNNPPWRCDYHSDVNVQMNYWFVDQTNLSECFQPFADYQFSVRGSRIDATKKQFGKEIRGWATRSENGIFGGSSYLWVPGDAAWLAQNIWDHYAYTKDKVYLKNKAYPILKELCEFWEDYAITTKDGKLISPPSVSPEHGPKVAGNAYEDQLMYDLFTNYIEASTDLGIDEDFRKKVTDMRARLLGPRIGRWGQIQEWMEDRDDPKNQHRHLSHLIAVYPGRQIAPLTTPKLAEAAAVSLNARGDDGTGWSIGWKINLWARLNDGDRAHRILQNSLRVCKTTRIVMNYAGGTYPNLLMAHPPFQIEANFGYASGFCELLMQSHLGEIHLLPSLPKAWPDGKIKGLKARGNYEINMEWANGELRSATIKSPNGTIPKIRIANGKSHIDPNQDQRVQLTHIR